MGVDEELESALKFASFVWTVAFFFFFHLVLLDLVQGTNKNSVVRKRGSALSICGPLEVFQMD